MPESECPECHAFRLDGKPVTVHRNRCTRGPDGAAIGVLWTTDNYDPGVKPVKKKR